MPIGDSVSSLLSRAPGALNCIVVMIGDEANRRNVGMAATPILFAADVPGQGKFLGTFVLGRAGDLGGSPSLAERLGSAWGQIWR